MSEEDAKQEALVRLYRLRERVDQDIAELHRQLGTLPAYAPLKFAAYEVGFSGEVVRRWALAGLIDSKRDGARWLVSLASLHAFVGARHGGLRRRCA